MPWWYAVVESRHHEVQNPTSPEKIRRLGELLELAPESSVLDIASGKGGPARILADAFGCRITCVENAPEFAAVARERATDLIEVVRSRREGFRDRAGRLRRRLVPWRVLRLRRSRRDAQPAEACRAVRRRGRAVLARVAAAGGRRAQGRVGGLPSLARDGGPLRVRGRARRLADRLLARRLGPLPRRCTGWRWTTGWPRIRAIPTPRRSGSAGGAIASRTFAGSATCSAGPSSYAVG